MEKKKGLNRKAVLLLVLACILIAVACIGITVLMKGIGDSEKKCTLYWNVDKEQYLSDSGLSNREPAEDGYYKVVFAVDGEQVEYSVSDKSLVDEIDNRDLMGLETDKKGIITNVLDPDEATGRELVSRWYITTVESGKIEVSDAPQGSNLKYELEITEDTGIYDVTGTEPVGRSVTPKVGDCVRVFRGYEKEIIYVFIVKDEEAFAGNRVTKYCEHCKAEVEWYEWTEETTLPTTEGHWCLMNDVTLTLQQKITTNKNVVVDLNGKTVSGCENRRVYYVGTDVVAGKLVILDQSTGKTGTIKGSGYVQNGGVIFLKAGTFELYSGTIDASQIDTEYRGVALFVDADAACNMYGGIIIGGTSRCGGRAGNTSFLGGGGGSVYLNNRSTFTMYDGTIRDGKVYACKNGEGYAWGIGGNIDVRSDATFIMEGGEIINGFAEKEGGNIYLTKDNARFIMRGGVISGGATQLKNGKGGNIYIAAGCKLELENGEIKGGRAMEAGGGNVMIYGTLSMSGGSITGGSSITGETVETAVKRTDVYHGNIYCSNGYFEMSGGYIDGNVSVLSSNTVKNDGTVTKSTVKLSGTAQIIGGERNLVLPTGFLLEIGTLEKGANISVYGKGFISEETAKANLAYVHSDYEGVEVSYSSKKLIVGKESCICGGSHVDSEGKIVTGHYGACDGGLLEWLPWTSDTSMPTASGNWYLTKDVKLTGQKIIAKDAKIAVDLNGHTVTGAEGERIYLLRAEHNVQMTITDLSEKKEGKLIPVGTEYSATGSALLVAVGNKVVMYGGTMDGSKVSSNMSGTLLTIRKEGSFVMYGGTMIGGKSLKVKQENGSYKEGNAGTVLIEGEFSLYDGIIRGGKADVNGGNIYVNNGKLSVYGGRIQNGTAANTGGNICVKGQCDMVDGLVTGGTAAQGGNVQLLQNAVMNLAGGMIEKGIATNNGGNINGWSKSSFNMTGGTVKDGQAPVRAGNVGMTGYITMTGGIIKDGVVTQEAGNANTSNGIGGNVYVAGWTSKENDVTTVHRGSFTMSGGLVTGGTAVNGRGGNVYVTGNADMTLSGKAIIEKGTSLAGGGNVFIYDNSTVTVKGGEIRDGKDSSSGGNIRVAAKSQLTVTDGKIYGGQTTNTEKNTYGGNISDVSTATITISGGEISNGSVPKGMGGNIYIIGTITISDTAVIEGGNAGTGSGGNIGLHAETAAMLMNGGTIRDGAAGTGYNVAVLNGAKLTIHQGTIEGGTQNGDAVSGNVRVAASGQDLLLGSGVIKISGPNGGLYLEDGRKIVAAKELNRDTDIAIRLDKNRVFMENATESYQKNFVADQEGRQVFYDVEEKKLYMAGKVLTEEELANGVVFDLKNVDIGSTVASNAIPVADREKYSAVNDDGKKLMFSENGIKVVAANAHVHCPCGDAALTEGACAEAGHYEVEYTILTATTNFKTGGNYYLADDLAYEYSQDFTKQGMNKTANICLNGHKLTFASEENASERWVMLREAYHTLSINGKCAYSDGNAKGEVEAVTKGENDNVGVFFVQGGASLNLYNMTLNVEKWVMSERGENQPAGAAVFLNSGGRLCTYNLTLVAAKTTGQKSYAWANVINRGVKVAGNSEWKKYGTSTGLVEDGEVHDLQNVAIGTVISTTKIPVAARAYHTVINANGKKLMFSENGIKVVAADAHVHCPCGDETRTEGSCYKAGHYEIEFSAMTSGDESKLAGKNLYLTENVTWTSAREIITASNKNINLCLNGYTLTKKGNERIIQYNSSGGTMNVCGRCEYTTARSTGSITGISATNQGQVGLLWVQGKVTLNLYDMILNAEAWSMTTRDISSSNVKKGQGNGAGILVQSGCTLSTYGSTIVPAKDFGANSSRKAYTNRGVFIYTGGSWSNPGGLAGAVETGK